MRRLSMIMVSLLAMMAVGSSLKAQEVTITLSPGYTWISYLGTEPQDFATALGSFTPEVGDVIKSQVGNATYLGNGQWRGSITQFYPGCGYMYKSTRMEPVTITMCNPILYGTVTTTHPTDITTTSAVVGGTVTIGEGNHVYDRGVCWGTDSNPNIDDNHISNVTEIGSFSDTLTGLTPNTTYYVRAYVVTDYGLAYGEELSFTTEDEGGGHAYVDLGLPSGLLWATCNVGADTPEDYGDYFAWGETTTKSTSYNWSTYQYCNGSENTLTKYCNNSNYGYNGFTDNLTTLLPEDDAATANWGSGWRMPTNDEWTELIFNTNITWTTQNGVYGTLFTAINGNSLFLPAAGYRDNNGLVEEGSLCLYWSGLLFTGDPHNALGYLFHSGYGNTFIRNRCLGQSVRPVYSGAQNTFIVNATANPAEGGEVNGRGIYYYGNTCTISATANEGYVFVNWTENGEVVSTDASYTFTVNAERTLVANFNGEHAYVDLGLPSGLLWATCNVGANAPEGYGNYFAWGETQPKYYYDWSTYQHSNGGSWEYPNLTKYCNNSSCGYNGFTDNLTNLLPEDDAATANWGSNWRMPTEEEWQELYQNTTHTWTTQNGVNGRLFTASNGNSLFLPNAGYRYGSSLINAGSSGNYSSSSLYTVTPSGAWGFYFESGGCIMIDVSRVCGQPVRPVRSASQNTSFIINASSNPTEGGEVSGGGALQEGSECTLTATANMGYTFVNWTENDEVVSTDAIYTFTVNADRTLVANFINAATNHAYVDLGLPSGLLWATCNVGADAPEEYGDYFAWGETAPKDTYNWSTYQYCMGSYNTLTKYCDKSGFGYNGFTDTLTILLPEDDAATASWGDGWRMPTKEEWQELCQNTTHSWTTQNGVYGSRFTASNGNSLFLPAADRDGSTFIRYGHYWSSSLFTSRSDCASGRRIGSDGCTGSGISRYYGYSVRPVRSSQ